MNFKKTFVSAVATVALSISLVAPMAFADSSQTASSTIDEGGEFTFQMGFSSVSFTAEGVTTSQSVIVQSSRGSVSFNDTHAYNDDGWSLSVHADDFKTSDGVYSIDSDNFRVWERSKAGCTMAASSPVVGGNNYQTITDGYLPTGPGSTAVPKGLPMSSDQKVVSGSEGRGCGASSVGLYYQLTVPAGTYTAGGSAVYTTDITLTNTMEVGEGD